MRGGAAYIMLITIGIIVLAMFAFFGVTAIEFILSLLGFF